MSALTLNPFALLDEDAPKKAPVVVKVDKEASPKVERKPRKTQDKRTTKPKNSVGESNDQPRANGVNRSERRGGRGGRGRGGFRGGRGGRGGGGGGGRNFDRKPRGKFVPNKEKRDGKGQYNWGENATEEVPADVPSDEATPAKDEKASEGDNASTGDEPKADEPVVPEEPEIVHFDDYVNEMEANRPEDDVVTVRRVSKTEDDSVSTLVRKDLKDGEMFAFDTQKAQKASRKKPTKAAQKFDVNFRSAPTGRGGDRRGDNDRRGGRGDRRGGRGRGRGGRGFNDRRGRGEKMSQQQTPKAKKEFTMEQDEFPALG